MKVIKTLLLIVLLVCSISFSGCCGLDTAQIIGNIIEHKDKPKTEISEAKIEETTGNDTVSENNEKTDSSESTASEDYSAQTERTTAKDNTTNEPYTRS
jgi:hypothetical protein